MKSAKKILKDVKWYKYVSTEDLPLDELEILKNEWKLLVKKPTEKIFYKVKEDKVYFVSIQDKGMSFGYL